MCIRDRDNTDHKAPDIENGGADQDDDTHKFHGIAKFKAGLGVVGDGDESHVQHGFGVKPPGFHSVFSQYDTGDDAERGSKHIWGVYCCQPQADVYKRQLYYPFYKRDIENGTLTREQMQELIECMFIKMDHHCKIRDYGSSLMASGVNFGGEALLVGGVDARGNDITNDQMCIRDRCCIQGSV